ncbi:MAG: hypothetical protein GTN97_03320 [Nitrosopumilaceae archaeon]|nr:hypothetical protein [Nitrosopumilaceae archaeon]
MSSTKQQKAQDLFDNGSVNQVNNDTFVVHGSGTNQYEVKENHDPMYNYDYYCKCPAWKFDNTRQCKHVLAVELFKANGANVLPNAQQQAKMQAQRAMNRRTASGYKVKKENKKAKEFDEIEFKDKNGKKKPLKFDKNGKLIPQYTKIKIIEHDDEIEEDEYD